MADARRATRATAGKDNMIQKRSHHEFRKNFFSQRVVRDWNNLPDSIKSAKNATCFKRLLRRHTEGTAALAMGIGRDQGGS